MINKIPLDKQLHIFSGGFLAALLMPFGMPTAWVGVAAAAVLKELWDSTGRGTPDKWDAFATIVGGSVVISWLSLF